MRARPGARLAALALVPIFLLGAALPAAASSVCFGSMVRGESCCTPSASSHARLERRCCCEIDEQSAPATPRHESAAASPRGPEVLVFAALPIAVAAFTREAAAPTRAPVVPPATGPPIILLKRSFLL